MAITEQQQAMLDNMCYVATEAKLGTLLTEIIDEGIGKKTTEGGEIFNDYTNNKASGESSHAEGSFTNASIVNSHAEGRFTSTAIKGFKVLEIDATNNKARLSKDDVSKLSLWNKIGVVDRNNTYYSGSITKIDGVWVTISSSVPVNKFIVNPTSTNIQGYLIPYVVNNGKPIGSIELNTDALSVSSHTEGSGTHAFLDAHAEGKNVFAPGKASHGEGLGTQSVGDYSHAEGHYSVSKGNGSHSEGDNSISSGDYSHAENYNTRANAESSHTEGIRCITTVDAKGGHAEGANTKVNAYAAHAEGNNTIASSEAQHVEGAFNIEDTENKYIHIAGNGYVDSNNNEIRQNAHTIDRGGNAWFSGWVKIGGASFDDENAQYLITDQILRGVLSETEKKYDEINITLEQKADKTSVDVALERIKYYGSADIAPSDESYFTVNETGETITGLTETGKTQTELVIPYEINGKKITTLYSGVTGYPQVSILNGSSTITKVVIPKSVTTLGEGAFYNCAHLIDINIPDSVTSIGEEAFKYCSSLKSINIPNSVTSIGFGAFAGCSSLKSINIPDSVTSISHTTFAGCSSLKSINIPNSVTSIGATTFESSLNFTIYCEQGSYADTYAKEKGRPVVYTDVKDIGSNVEIVNNLTTSDSTKALSANQGKILNDTKANVTAVLTKTNTTAFTPTANYHPATKKYVDDLVSTSGGGDMLKTVYDTDNTGVVDNAEKLGGQLPSYYAKASTSVVVTLPNTVADWAIDTDENGETYYTKSFSNETFTSDGTPFVGVNYSDTISIARQQAEAYDSIDRVKVADGMAIFYCFNNIPSVSLDIQIKMVY